MEIKGGRKNSATKMHSVQKSIQQVPVNKSRSMGSLQNNSASYHYLSSSHHQHGWKHIKWGAVEPYPHYSQQDGFQSEHAKDGGIHSSPKWRNRFQTPLLWTRHPTDTSTTETPPLPDNTQEDAATSHRRIPNHGRNREPHTTGHPISTMDTSKVGEQHSKLP